MILNYRTSSLSVIHTEMVTLVTYQRDTDTLNLIKIQHHQAELTVINIC